MVFQRLNTQAVEIGAAVGQVPVVGVPGRQGIVIHPGGGENGFPELLHSAALGLVGEDFFGPGCAGNGGDAPLVLALDPVAVGLDDGIAGLLALGHLFQVDALETVGILGRQIQPAGELVRHILQLSLLKGLHRGQGLDAAVAHMELLQGLVAEFHKNLPGAGLVQLVGDHGHEFRLVQLGIQEHVLALLYVAALAGNQLGIAAKSCFLHEKSSFA